MDPIQIQAILDELNAKMKEWHEYVARQRTTLAVRGWHLYYDTGTDEEDGAYDAIPSDEIPPGQWL